MIEITGTIKKITEYLQSFYPNTKKIQVEEMVLSDDKKFWDITMSYETDEPQSGSFLATEKSRKYKVFRIDSESGEVLSMKVRNF
jgi:hypothetical protein